MLQTSPSGATTAAAVLEPAPRGGGNAAAGGGEFTQEFDKQVKNVESQRQPQGGAAAAGKPAKATAAQQAEAEKGRSEAATPRPGGGKLLPPQARQGVAEAAEGESPADAQNASAAPAIEAPLLADEAGAEEIVAEDAVLLAESPTEELPATPGGSTTVGINGAMTAATEADVAANTEEAMAEEGMEQGFKAAGRERPAPLSAAVTEKSLAGAERNPDSAAPTPGARSFAAVAEAVNASPLLSAATPGVTASRTPLAMTLAVPMQQANWGGAVAERVVWMTNANIQEAEIQLHPRELGPIGIRVTQQNDQTHVSFVAQHATTREALEAALPRLREMLNEQGLQLGQSDVSQHDFRQRGDNHDGSGNERAAQGAELSAGSDEGAELHTVHGVSSVARAGVDAFA